MRRIRKIYALLPLKTSRSQNYPQRNFSLTHNSSGYHYLYYYYAYFSSRNKSFYQGLFLKYYVSTCKRAKPAVLKIIHTVTFHRRKIYCISPFALLIVPISLHESNYLFRVPITGSFVNVPRVIVIILFANAIYKHHINYPRGYTTQISGFNGCNSLRCNLPFRPNFSPARRHFGCMLMPRNGARLLPRHGAG